jgi:hypothetical protein
MAPRSLALAAFVIAGAARVALADPKVCATPPKDASPRVLKVVAGKDHTFQPGSGSEFPAVSADGEEMAELFVDKDGAGVTITTLSIWAIRGGRKGGPKEVVSESVGGKGFGRDMRDPNFLDQYMNHVVDGVNKSLAKHKWRPISVYRPCDPKTPSLQLGGGLAFSIDVSSGRVTRDVEGKDPTRMRLPLDVLGTEAGTLPDGTGGAHCGTLTGIAWGFGGVDEGLAVLVPGATIGRGCFRTGAAISATPFQTFGDGG